MRIKSFKKKITLSTFQFTLVIIIIALFISAFILNSEWSKWEQNEQLLTFEEYLIFQSRVELYVNGSLDFVKGYSAYLNVLDEVNSETTEVYLNEILVNDEYPISNIAVIEDTTIKSVYPLEGNESAIGVDLSLIEDQKDDIAFVKRELKPLFVGPVNLVEGGQGFISRIPVVKNDQYFGQISVVLEAKSVLDRIESIAKDIGIHVNVYSGDQTLLEMIEGDSSSLSVEMELIGKPWQLDVRRGENPSRVVLYYYIVIALVISGACGVIAGVIYHQRVNLKRLAFTDYLTGVYNRNFIEHYIPMVFDRAIRENHSVGVYHIDVNDFKSVNDIYGHHVGDLVLKDIADKIVNTIRSYETVFRLGGDEFMVVATDLANEEEFHVIKNRLTEALSYNFERNSVQLKISASVGGAMYPKDGRNFDEVLQKSDLLMYEMKETMKK